MTETLARPMSPVEERTAAWHELKEIMKGMEHIDGLDVTPEGHYGFSVLDGSGDNVITWNVNDRASTALGKKMFNLARKAGMAIHLLNAETGEKDEIVTKFPATAGKLLAVPATAGG